MNSEQHPTAKTALRKLRRSVFSGSLGRGYSGNPTE